MNEQVEGRISGRLWWVHARPGKMRAVRVGMTDVDGVAISETEPEVDIQRQVGDATLAQLVELEGLQIWVGGGSREGARYNVGATGFIRHLLGEMADGNYAVSDEMRERVRDLFSTDTLPSVYGTCVITGVGEDGEPGPLDERFQSWLTRTMEELDEQWEEAKRQVSAITGIPVELLGGELIFARGRK